MRSEFRSWKLGVRSFLITIFYLLTTSYCFAQQDNHVFVERGSTTTLSWKAAGDYSAYDSLYFVVKPCTSNTCSRLIQKKTTKTYSEPYTTMTCTLYVDETASFNAARYYYSIYAYGADTVWVTSGNFNLMLNGQTPTDGVASRTPYYTVALDTPNVANTFIVGQDSNNTWYRKSVPEVRTILNITQDTTQVNANFDSLYTYWVNTHEAQTITGQKNFTGTVKIGSDSDYVFGSSHLEIKDTTEYYLVLDGTGNSAAPSKWYYSLTNYWVNSGRPNQTLRWGYNTNNGGGKVVANDINLYLHFENWWVNASDDTVFEAHLAATNYDGLTLRPWSWMIGIHNTSPVSASLTADILTFNSRWGTALWQMTDSSALDFYTPSFRFAYNNKPFAKMKFPDDSYADLPYINDEYEYYLGGYIGTISTVAEALNFDSTRIILNDNYPLVWREGGVEHNVLNFNEDIITLGTDKTVEVNITGSGLYFLDSLGNSANLVTPIYPFDTTGLAIGKTYVNPNTGGMFQVIGADLVVNGDFSDWSSGYQPDDWTSNTPDTVNFYYENDGGKLHFISYNKAVDPALYQGAEGSTTYGYSFVVSQIVDTFSVNIAHSSFQITETGVYTGEAIGDGLHTLVSLAPQYGTCEITIDNIRIWDLSGAKAILTPAIYLPDTMSVAANLVPKYDGAGGITWEADAGGAGSDSASYVNHDSRWVTADSLILDAEGAARFQPLDSDLTDLADGSLTFTKVAGLQDSLNLKLNKSDSTIYLTPSDASAAYSAVGHTHSEFTDTLSKSWGVMDTVTTGDYTGWKVDNNITITEISAYTNTGTVTFNLEERVETTPNTAGTDVIGSDLVADDDQQETGTFTNAAIDRDDWLVPTVTSISGDPTIFTITVRYVKTN